VHSSFIVSMCILDAALTHALHLLAAKVYDIVWDETIANGEVNAIAHYMNLMVES